MKHIVIARKQIKSVKQFFHCTACTTPKSVTSLRGPSPRLCACGQQSHLRRNVTAVASRWQHCVRLDRPDIWSPDLPDPHNQRIPVLRAVTHSFLKQVVWGSNFGPVKSNRMLPTACHYIHLKKNTEREAILSGKLAINKFPLNHGFPSFLRNRPHSRDFLRNARQKTRKRFVVRFYANTGRNLGDDEVHKRSL